MKTYLVVNPWNKDVKAGQQIETASLHPALLSHVREVEVATPVAKVEPQLDKKSIVQKLQELGIQFDGRKSAAELAALLPQE